jgi:hypothetical protein
MLRWKGQRRALFGEKFLDLANYAAAALVFSQFVSEQPVSWRVGIAGAMAWLVFAALSYWLAGEQ